MSKKLTIKGITFPNFGNDDSKKNFRLIFYVGYTDKNGDDAVAVVSKPAEKDWQWKSKNDDAYIKPTVVGDSVQLDTGVLKLGDGNAIASGSNKIVDVDGEITDVMVQFMDVHNKTLGNFFIKNILPELLTTWEATGLNPIDMAPIPGVVKVLLNDKVDLKKMANDAQSLFAKKGGDKILHSISVEYHDEHALDVKEDHVPWGKDGKTGNYGVKIGVAG